MNITVYIATFDVAHVGMYVTIYITFDFDASVTGVYLTDVAVYTDCLAVVNLQFINIAFDVNVIDVRVFLLVS